MIKIMFKTHVIILHSDQTIQSQHLEKDLVGIQEKDKK